MLLPAINNIVEVCAKQQLEDVILSPGSRCAPLTIAFNRHEHFNPLSIPDERAAAFTALGMSLKSQKASILVCTSGSAALNYAPAVAEGYFQQIPMIVMTADRPPEWIDQLDGQTIRQTNVFGNHVKKSYDLPVDYTHPDAQWQINRIINDAINLAHQAPAGPVHLNIPFREPFYPTVSETVTFDENSRTIKQWAVKKDLAQDQWQLVKEQFESFDRPLIVVGQAPLNDSLIRIIDEFSKKYHIPVVADGISNFQSLENAIGLIDNILMGANNKANLQPDLLITFGKSVISKPLKIFLRQHKAQKHWHIQEEGIPADTFQQLTDTFNISPTTFFSNMNSGIGTTADINWFEAWATHEQHQRNILSQHFAKETAFHELAIVHQILQALPAGSDLHLANSMTVRNANFVGIPTDSDLEVFCNRGTSGIDGSNSTAIGSAIKSGNITTLITGDLAFFYDRNGFWNNYLPKNLRVIVINNHCGGIFGVIQGPSQLPELEDYFETHQPLDAQKLASDHQMEYACAQDATTLKNSLEDFYQAGNGPKILEINVDKALNKAAFSAFKTLIKTSPCN
ncbi:2-succinyl-5-enolpyruvyl-6-hydroxy-3-cyclohexene-1-carboxylic-acid synthase [Persicobacter psychrovividus]|uniref:2-succinyl-5-enolpyruvyl-6-hydroxy-3-cyclohexene-1-carboxylate synthase n=1 Tax=Persicobacter psychrovividus TaxID=387638 RepID=A0ABN6LDG5_9BACT|nr:2-succinyl-5-enolpyruvyl-6-hydroxy-3-cyclohexene- 1-carboxylate synthase [Persicobacter psychrovividus]